MAAGELAERGVAVLLVFHAPADRVVSIEHAGRIYQVALWCRRYL